ncbi:MAG: hypothetical protein AB7N61_20795 [Acidimicrobiia bacterium]
MDVTVAFDLDLTLALAQAGVIGNAVELTSLRLHEVDGGSVVDSEVPFQFDPAADFDPVARARGELLIFLASETVPGVNRSFYLYFELEGVGLTAPPVNPLVRANWTSSDEGRMAARMETDASIWYYQLDTGALSSLLDGGGNDWIAFSTAAGSAGEFRGIPNLVHPEGIFSPRFEGVETLALREGPLRSQLVSESADGLWRIRWDFFSDRATATVLAAPRSYWFLYEGVPGGAIDDGADFFLLPDGTVQPLTKKFSGDLVDEEWVAFGDPAVDRGLIVVNHVDDQSPDSYRTMNREMTVFGFGRSGLTPSITGINRSFSVALIEGSSAPTLAAAARAIADPPAVQVGTGETAEADLDPPLIADLQMVNSGPATMEVAFSTDEPAQATASLTSAASTGPVSGASSFALDHRIAIGGLACETSYVGTLTVSDGSGNSNSVSLPPTETGACMYPVEVSVVGSGSVVRVPDQSVYAVGSEVLLSAVPGPGAEFEGWSGDVVSSESAITVTVPDSPVDLTATFSNPPSPTVGFVSDDFDAPVLGEQWQVVDPKNDASVMLAGSGTGQATLSLSVPTGAGHDAWNQLNAPHVVQAVADVDFELELGMGALPSSRYQMQGVVVKQDDDDWLRFDVYHDGSGLRVFAAVTTAGKSASRVNRLVSADAARFLRVSRMGDSWSFSHSGDGLTWTTAVSFDHELVVSSAGVFAGNAGLNPAHSAVFDYVFDVANPVDPEDGTSVASFPVEVSVVGSGSVVRVPDQSVYAVGSEVLLSAVPGPGAEFEGWSGDVVSSESAITVTVPDSPVDLTATFSNPPSPTVGFVSDDFDAPVLGEQWQVVDPKNDASVMLAGSGTGQATLSLSVPTGAGHDAWNQLNAPHVVQAVADVDFELELGMGALPSSRYQMQGVVVKQDDDDWLRFDVYHDGSGLRVFAAVTTAGKSASRVNRLVSADAARFLRVSRMGDSWSFSHSGDGLTWTTAVSFDHELVVSSAGVFAGNAGLNPAHSAVFDYVFDVANPVDPEDGTSVASFPVEVSVVGSGSVVRVPDQSVYAVGSEVLLSAVPGPGAEFEGWSGDVVSSESAITVTVPDSPVDLTATFSTPTAAASIDVWYGDRQVFGEHGVSQRWVNVLGNAFHSQGILSLGYRVNDGPPVPLSIGPDQRRLQRPGDFNIELDPATLVLGENHVEITLVGLGGDIATRDLTLVWQPTAVGLPIEVRWDEPLGVGSPAQAVDGRWVASEGQVRTGEVGYDRTLVVGDLSLQDYEVEATVTIEGVGPGAGAPLSGDPLVGFGLRWQGHSAMDGSQPRWGFWPTGAFAWYTLKNGGRFDLLGNGSAPAKYRSGTIGIGETYILKARVETEVDGDRYQFKWWRSGEIEPAGWMSQIVEPDGPATGSVLLIAHHLDVRFGNVLIKPLA